MKNAGIDAKVDGRVKHFFSIYKKMVNQHKTLDQIYDLFAVRIIVETVKDCYAALGVIHEMYKPIPGRFKDYIAMPKPNMYQSLHTTLIGSSGQPFEIQIRTYEMHRTAEYGIAAHWKYKESGSGQAAAGQEEEKLSWLRQILEWQRDMSDNKEFLKPVKERSGPVFRQRILLYPHGRCEESSQRLHPHRLCLCHPQRRGQQDGGSEGERQAGDHRLRDPERGPDRDHHLPEFQGTQPGLAQHCKEHPGEEQDQPVVQDRS